mmetsp:Transcript_7624/g.19009  ORF Transcript_7624/g.19009 Transcript_7624/m.19009 type:complete len:89 (+) Transcript_7624:552-818(+)
MIQSFVLPKKLSRGCDFGRSLEARKVELLSRTSSIKFELDERKDILEKGEELLAIIMCVFGFSHLQELPCTKNSSILLRLRVVKVSSI